MSLDVFLIIHFYVKKHYCPALSLKLYLIILLNNIKAYDLEKVTLLNKTHVGFVSRKNTTAYLIFSLLFSIVYSESLR